RPLKTSRERRSRIAFHAGAAAVLPVTFPDAGPARRPTPICRVARRRLGSTHGSEGNDPAGLVGEQLKTVAFVMNLVGVKFNGPVVRALTNPIVESDGLRLRYPESGSRDALCSLIGSEVEAVTVNDD